FFKHSRPLAKSFCLCASVNNFIGAPFFLIVGAASHAAISSMAERSSGSPVFIKAVRRDPERKKIASPPLFGGLAVFSVVMGGSALMKTGEADTLFRPMIGARGPHECWGWRRAGRGERTREGSLPEGPRPFTHSGPRVANVSLGKRS